MATTYRWTAGAHIKANAQSVGEALDALQRSHGERLTPRVVVEAAHDAESPLHSCFEWDNAKAAELYREDQARQVIRCLRAVVTDGDKTTERRVYVNVIEAIDGEDEHGYATLSRVLSSDNLRQQLIVQARADLIAFKDRYAELSELAEFTDLLLKKIDALQPSLAEVAA